MSFVMENVTPLCPVFGECGGCATQNISYEEELRIKKEKLREILSPLKLDDSLFQPIVPSPRPYHYRNRLDIALRRIKSGEIFMGFVNPEKKRTIQITSCAIAMEAVSDFIPQLRNEAIARLTSKYRMASLVVKTGDEGKVFWGGIGRKSLQMNEADYLWTKIDGIKIHYSLDTFFQANLSILPLLRATILQWAPWTSSTTLFDLYGGVGLFTMMFAKKVGRTILIEEHPASIRLAHYNISTAQLKNVEVIEGKVEDHFFSHKTEIETGESHGIIDPPRNGLSEKSRELLSSATFLKSLFYLSCNPETLRDDLQVFLNKEWRIKTLIPFDFFPKTKHLEVLTLLLPPSTDSSLLPPPADWQSNEF